MMFIELMFWKNASVAESVRDDYNWRVRCFCCKVICLSHNLVLGRPHLYALCDRQCLPAWGRETIQRV